MGRRTRLRRFHRGEKKMLYAKLHDRKLPLWIAQRYRIIVCVNERVSVRTVARQLGCSKNTAYRCVSEFNEHGFQRFERCSNPEGRPTQITAFQLKILLRIAKKRPTDVGLPFTNWSISKLQEYLVKHKKFPRLSPEWIRRLLHRENVSWQHTKTWKQSRDPDFATKKSAFWNSIRSVPSMAPWFAMISWVPWNCDPSQECVGLAKENHNDNVPPTHASKGQSNYMASMMFMPIAWLASFANERLLKISKLASPECGPVIQSRSASMWSWTISQPINEQRKISSLDTTWKPSICQPKLPG